MSYQPRVLLMVSIAKTRIMINAESRAWLKHKGVDVPDKALSVEHILVPELSKYTEQFTFKDGFNLRLQQQVNRVDKTNNKKTVQIREYDYIKRFYGKEKISEIRQKTIDNNGVEDFDTWRFYYPKDNSPVRFSHKEKYRVKNIKSFGEDDAYTTKSSEVNNYLRSDGYITDRNGLKIRPISLAEYVDKRKDIDDKHFIDCPWTLRQSITTKDKCATDSIQECTVVGIYGDKGISLNHLNPNNPVNKNFYKLEDALLTQLEQQGKNAKAFVIGSCESDHDSNKQFAWITDILTVNKISYSKFKTGDKVLYGQFQDNTSIKSSHSKKYKYGTATPFEWQSGQHIIYNNGELQIANTVIDSELKKGHTDPENLIKKSFSKIYR